MKRQILVLTACLAAVLAASCNNDMSSASRMSESGATQRNSRSQRTVIDAGKFVNFSDARNNARETRKEDVMYLAYGEFRHEGGNSVIKIDRKDGTVTMTSDSAFFGGNEGQQFYLKYRFDVSAAGSDCLYIKPLKKEGAAGGWEN